MGSLGNQWESTVLGNLRAGAGHPSEHQPAIAAPGVMQPGSPEGLRRVTARAVGIAGYAVLELHLTQPHHAIHPKLKRQMLWQSVGDEWRR